MPEYDHIISLGGNCAPAAAIRNCFGITKAFPFDWWIFRTEHLEHLISNNFERMFEEQDVVLYKNGESVISTKYWIWYHHDFERDANDEVLPDIARQLPKVREKYAFLCDRLERSVSRSKVLFVRGDQEPDDAPDYLHHKTSKLLDTLQRRWPVANISLLCLYKEELLPELRSFPPKQGLIWDTLGPPTGEMWRTEQFAAAFRRHDVRLSGQVLTVDMDTQTPSAS
jgi:hypothetical protein